MGPLEDLQVSWDDSGGSRTNTPSSERCSQTSEALAGERTETAGEHGSFLVRWGGHRKSRHESLKHRDTEVCPWDPGVLRGTLMWREGHPPAEVKSWRREPWKLSHAVPTSMELGVTSDPGEPQVLAQVPISARGF